jgi:hypothetical protein
MKLLKIKTLVILKLALLFSVSNYALSETILVSDRLVLKIVDQVYSLQDFKYQSRNLSTLKCVFSDSVIVSYFTPDFIAEFRDFVGNYPKTYSELEKYYDKKDKLLKKIRYFFKGIKYSEDQKLVVSDEVETLVRESTKINKCDSEILKTNGLKSNFVSLLRLELYLRSRYLAGDLSSKKKDFGLLKSSIDLFIDSLDKQFSHEYFR